MANHVNHFLDYVEPVYLSQRALPNAPDGTYEPVQEDPGKFLNTINRLRTLDKGVRISQDPHAIGAFVHAISGVLTHKGVNDREHAFEDGLDLLSRCAPDSSFVKAMNDVAISGLYTNLPHPPTSFVGRSKFRQADGGYNNPHWPDIGKAGQPYARNAQLHTPIPSSDLPEPGLVFDALLSRRDAGDPKVDTHPNGNSAFTFAFATLVTHSLFRTNIRDNTINDTSSYLDLSPLYGNSPAEQSSVRIKDGRGKLFPDCFAEDRLTHLPPACSALLIIFNRNHNYTADMLLKINEKGSWKDPSSFKEDDPTLIRQDEEIFQTARLINCGHFMSMILNDYVAGFLGNTRNGRAWHMQPFNKIYGLDGTEVGRGQGNHVSVEFNLLYRWHSTVSAKDEDWTNELVSKAFGTTDFQNITVPEFISKAMDRDGPFFPKDEPKTRDYFPGFNLKRGEDGRYSDDDIARFIQDSTASPAHRYGARATPPALRIVEIMTILQGREWGVCTMNEFRKCMGLKPFDSFEEWNSDKEIADAARKLYQHIDRLELYPGLQAEETMKLHPGSGFCCGYTTMRAILADAICLIRGDRFFTTDFTPGNLTAWGFGDVEPIQDNGAFGACLPKLLLRHLPNNYTYNSVYALFPFFTPEAMEVNLTEQGIQKKYDFEKPSKSAAVVTVETLRGIKTVFDDFKRFKVTYTDDMEYLTQGYGFFVNFDEKILHDKDKRLALNALWDHSNMDGHDKYPSFAHWYKTTTRQLIEEHSFSYDLPSNSKFKGRYVDIVRNVINITSVRWAADYLIGLSLKNKQNPHGEFTESEAYQMLMVLFMCVFEDVDPEHGWFLRSKAKEIADRINGIIENSIEQVRPRHPLVSLFAKATTLITLGNKDLTSNRPCYDFLRRLVASGRPLKDLTATVIGLAVGSSVNYAQASAQIVDFYLDDARSLERAEIVRLVKTPEDDEHANNLLIGYIKEAQRLAPQFPGLQRKCTADHPVRIEQGSGKEAVVIQPGQIVYASYYNAHINPIDFPDPLRVNPNRPRDSYAVQGSGFHACPGVNFAERTLLAVMRVIFSLKNLRRAEGAEGRLASFKDSQNGTPMRLYTDDKGAMTPWPGQLMVVYDE